jgi:xanthine dehydrogenase accessory factor
MLIYPNGTTRGSLGNAELDARAAVDYRERLLNAESKTVEYPGSDGPGSEFLVFYDVYPAPDRLLVFGGVHVAVPLVELAKVLGFRVTVVDARGQWANRDRFPKADEIFVGYADEYLEKARLDLSTYIVVLTHDPKLDDPALAAALASTAFYIGALGSRRTQAKRLDRLRAEGFDAAALARIHGPAGLAIGARSPAEIAVSILAQIIQVRRAGPAAPSAGAAA